MGYRSSGAYAIQRIPLPEMENKDKVYELLESDNEKSRELGIAIVNSVLSSVSEKEKKEIVSFFTDFDCYCNMSVIFEQNYIDVVRLYADYFNKFTKEYKQYADMFKMKDDVWVLSYSNFKYPADHLDLEEVTNVGVVRIGEESDDNVEKGQMWDYIGLSRNTWTCFD